MNLVELDQFIDQKKEKESILEQRKKEIEDIKNTLFTAKVSGSVRSIYYFIKRLIVLIMGTLCFLLFLSIIILPSFYISSDSPFVRDMVEGYKMEYADLVGQSVSESLKILISERSGDKLTPEIFVNAIDKAITFQVIEEMHISLIILGLLFLFLSLILFYISRLVRITKRRNALILKAQSLSSDILDNYYLSIEEEEKELQILQKIRSNPQTY